MMGKLPEHVIEALSHPVALVGREVIAQTPMFAEGFKRRWVLTLSCRHQVEIEEAFNEFPVQVVCLECSEAALRASDSSAKARANEPRSKAESDNAQREK